MMSPPINRTPLMSVSAGTSADAVASLFRVLLPDAMTVLDMTYGSGKFWSGGLHRVTGIDINPTRAKDVAADFTALPFLDESFDAAVFDPPYHTDMGKGKASVMGARFGHYASLGDLRSAVMFGCQEAWRVARLGIIVKVQDYIHGSKAVWMSRWVHDAMPVPPYDVLYLHRKNKIIDPKWREQLSVYRNHATFWVYRKDGPTHRRRKHEVS